MGRFLCSQPGILPGGTSSYDAVLCRPHRERASSTKPQRTKLILFSSQFCALSQLAGIVFGILAWCRHILLLYESGDRGGESDEDQDRGSEDQEDESQGEESDGDSGDGKTPKKSRR